LGLPRKSLLVTLPALIALAAFPSAAQSKGPVLPNSFGNFSGTVQPGLIRGDVHEGDDSVVREAGRQAAALKEYGLEAGEESGYTHGPDKLFVQLYRMKDPSGAYGEYTFLRKDDTHAEPVKIGDNAVISGDRALIQYGNFVFDVRGDAVKSAATDLSALVAAVAPRADHGPLPNLPQRLPEKGRVEHTDLYVLGPKVLGDSLPVLPFDWLGFSDDAEAVLARYRVRGDEFTFLLVDYPTPQVASRKLKELQEKYNANAASPKDGLPQIFAARQLTTLAIAVGARDKTEAGVLLNQIHADAEVTWNEPSFSVTEPSMVAMVVGAFIGTGIICVFAMISSLAFGGARLLIKRALPGKVFDRSSEVQILQLGLSSKPINAEDFYSLGGSSGK
jgi:hypothetical protein